MRARLAKGGNSAGRRCEQGPWLVVTSKCSSFGVLNLSSAACLAIPDSARPESPLHSNEPRPCAVSPRSTRVLPFAQHVPGELGTRAPAYGFMGQEMHFKLVPGYSDPAIRHHLLGVGDGSMCGERPNNARVAIPLAPPKHNRSRDGGLPVGQGAGEGRNLGVFTPRYVRVAGLSLNLWGGANLQIPVF